MKCDVCGRSPLVGVHINATDALIGEREAKRIEEAFGKKEFNICYVCWLQSFGVKLGGKNEV